MRSPATVAVLMPVSHHYTREAVLGVRRYAYDNEMWDLLVLEQDYGPNPLILGPQAREVAGLIGFFPDPGAEDIYRGLGVPTINVSSRSKES